MAGGIFLRRKKGGQAPRELGNPNQEPETPSGTGSAMNQNPEATGNNPTEGSRGSREPNTTSGGRNKAAAGMDNKEAQLSNPERRQRRRRNRRRHRNNSANYVQALRPEGVIGVGRGGSGVSPDI